MSFFRSNFSFSAEIVCRVFDDFSQKLNRQTVLILDNASIHKAAIIQKNRNKWKQRGLFLQFIPAYSPELNHIKILWRFVKHQWLEPWHYENIEALKENLIHIFQNIGQKYRIT